MKTLACWLVIMVLVSVYVAALFAVLHPHVSPAYKAYYIDHISSDWNPVHYPGSPEQGILFSRDGLPEWVQSTRGLSTREGWGRWTDEDLGSIAGVAFSHAVNGTFCVDLTARAVPWIVGQTIPVRMGNEVRDLHVASPELTKYQLQFTGLTDADQLDLLLPDKLPPVYKVVPTNGDRRRIALNLAALRLVPGQCPAGEMSSGTAR